MSDLLISKILPMDDKCFLNVTFNVIFSLSIWYFKNTISRFLQV